MHLFFHPLPIKQAFHLFTGQIAKYSAGFLDVFNEHIRQTGLPIRKHRLITQFRQHYISFQPIGTNGKLASIVIYIKMSRGEMTRFILKNRIENPEDLKSFSWEGFEFNESLSNEKKFVFTNGKEI